MEEKSLRERLRDLEGFLISFDPKTIEFSRTSRGLEPSLRDEGCMFEEGYEVRWFRVDGSRYLVRLILDEEGSICEGLKELAGKLGEPSDLDALDLEVEGFHLLPLSAPQFDPPMRSYPRLGSDRGLVRAKTLALKGLAMFVSPRGLRS